MAKAAGSRKACLAIAAAIQTVRHHEQNALRIPVCEFIPSHRLHVYPNLHRTDIFQFQSMYLSAYLTIYLLFSDYNPLLLLLAFIQAAQQRERD